MSVYLTQGYREKLNAKVATTGQRLYASDLRVALYGGRGGLFEELVYLRNKNSDAERVNASNTDAWVKFAPANSSGSSSNRADQQYHDFMINGAFP